jgi:hypothetical protein
MATYDFPSLSPTTSRFELVANTRVFASPLTNTIQTASRRGSYWKISLTFENLTGANRAELQAFLVKLNGQEHRFRIKDHSYVQRGTVTSDTGLTVTAGQTGSTLNVTSAQANKTGYLKAGDYINIENHLHMVTADCNSDGSGNVAIPIAPPLRETTTASDNIDVVEPVTGVFILTSSAGWESRPGIISNFSIEAIEDLLA